MNINEEFEKHKLYHGRMISGSKRSPSGQICIWNANVVIRSQGKVWFGDLNITKEGKKLQEIAAAIGETIYVLREHDCRFDSENDSIDILIQNAAWNTDM